MLNKKGVLQVSVLYPLVFLIYISPIINHIQEKYAISQIQAYVNDIIIISNSIEEFNKILTNIYNQIKKIFI